MFKPTVGLVRNMPRAWFRTKVVATSDFDETVRTIEQSHGGIAVVEISGRDFYDVGLEEPPPTVDILRYDSDSCEIKLRTVRPDVLVVSTRYDNAWHA